jgi:hypothetical protein
VNTTSCKLYVPYGSKGLYAAANQWKAFTTIIEMPQLSDSVLNLAADEGSKDSITIQSSSNWTIVSDQSWLTINPLANTGNKTLLFTALKNSLLIPRKASATVYVNGVSMQTISITQEAGEVAILEHNSIADTIVANGMINCFNAYDSITIAGGEDSVLFQNGSTVDLIAGKSIRFLPGFHAYEGSNVSASITPDSAFCDGASGNSIVNLPAEKSVKEEIQPEEKGFVSGGISIKIYPNPNNGKFSVVLTNFENGASITIYNMLGVRVYQSMSKVQDNCEINLSGLKKGIYFVKATSEKEQVTRKITVD